MFKTGRVVNRRQAKLADLPEAPEPMGDDRPDDRVMENPRPASSPPPASSTRPSTVPRGVDTEEEFDESIPEIVLEALEPSGEMPPELREKLVQWAVDTAEPPADPVLPAVVEPVPERSMTAPPSRTLRAGIWLRMAVVLRRFFGGLFGRWTGGRRKRQTRRLGL